MKRVVALLAVFLILFSMTLVFAADNETDADEPSDKTKIEEGFDCLEEKVGNCHDLTTQEVALTIMATPDNVFDDCVDELEDRASQNNWGNIRDTALAIIALKHAGKETEDYTEWLLAQNKTPTDLIWYLQQDSNEASECHVGYDTNDYTFSVNENKKISADAGPCLTTAQASFWLEISNNCYDKSFQIECDKDFIANLIYRNKNSPTVYVLEGTSSAPAFGSVELEVNSKCFGGTSCDYEATAWGALALLETGYNVDEFIPYIVAMSETNEKYLPESFIYILTNYEDYANALIEKQKLGNYWEAKSTAYSKYYDTSLALLALSSSSAEQITKAKEWLLFSQGSNGCWQNEVRETSMALWALEGRTGRSPSGDGKGSVTYCTEAEFFCIPSSECSATEDIGDNYFCPSLSDTCCESENLKSCSEYNGQECSSEEVCTGNTRKATDTNDCCTGSCEDRPQENECEANFYTCMDSCSEFQEPMSTYSCDIGQVCCQTKRSSGEESSLWWIWLLVFLILAVLGAIGYVYREQLKLYWFQIKTKFKKDDGKGTGPSSGPSSGSIPPRPGFPPIRRSRPTMTPRQRPVTSTQTRSQARSYDRRDKAMSDTFEKLRNMSK